jgi:hypothetical protein
MTPFWIATIALGCSLAGFLLGMLLQRHTPDDHKTGDSRDTVKMGLGLVATLAALVLGLLIASSKGSYDTQAGLVKEMAANLTILDRALARCGDEAKPIRTSLREGVEMMMGKMWPADGGQPAQLSARKVQEAGEELFDKMMALEAKTEAQKAMKPRAQDLMLALGQARQKLIAQQQSSIPMPFLVVLVSWVTLIFASYGLLSPRNVTAVVVQVICMLSVASALFLILEMDRPFVGMIRVPSAPLSEALSRMKDG